MGDGKNLIDKDKVNSARKALKRDFLIYICSLIYLFVILYLSPGVPLGLIKNEIGAYLFTAFLVILTFMIIILPIVVVFRIRYVYKPMGKSPRTIILFQLGSILIPFGIFMFPAIVLIKSKRALQEYTEESLK